MEKNLQVQTHCIILKAPKFHQNQHNELEKEHNDIVEAAVGRVDECRSMIH